MIMQERAGIVLFCVQHIKWIRRGEEEEMDDDDDDEEEEEEEGGI